MDLNQIAYVFDYVIAAIEQNELLADYDRLIAALSSVDEADDTGVGSAELVNNLRAELVAKQQALEPVNWQNAQLVVLEKYGARSLLGDVVADTLNQLFIDNFMNPEPIGDYVAGLRVDSAELLAQIKQLQADLAPLLTADLSAASAPVIYGDIIDSRAIESVQPMMRNEPENAGGRMLQTLKGAFNREPHPTSNAIAPFEETPLHLKVVAALPIAIAAASKALDIYRLYNDSKATALAPVSEKKQLPAPPQPTVNITQTVRYTYSQTTIFIDKK